LSGSTGIGAINYTISAGRDASGSPSLVNSTHGNNVGCTQPAWAFACTPVTANGSTRYDVGFGVSGANGNEIDGNAIGTGEFVKVTFTDRVFLNGFAGMLTYKRNTTSTATETVLLEAWRDDQLLQTFEATPLFLVNDPSNPANASFDTVGLAFSIGLNFLVDEVRFRAAGIPNFDDGNTNITAAGLKISAVPLPAGVLLLGLGLGGLALYRRKSA
jgi:hypothetical protein